MSNATAAVGSQATRIVYPDPEIPVFLGDGFNTLTHSLMRRAVDVVQASDPSATDAPAVTSELKLVKEMIDLRRNLGVDASASFSGFGTTASARTDFVNNAVTNIYSTFLLVHVRVTNPPKGIIDAKLTQEAESLINDGTDPLHSDFFQTYGDTYVSAISTGGELIGLVECKSDTEEQRQSVQAQANIAIKGITASGGGSIDYRSAFASISAATSMEVSVHRRGGDGPQPRTIGQLIEESQSFYTKVTGTPEKPGKAVRLSVTVDGYHRASGHRGKAPDVSFTENALSDLGGLRDRLKTMESNLDYIKKYPGQFEGRIVEQGRIEELQEKIKQIQRDIQKEANKCIDDPFHQSGTFDTLDQRVKAIAAEIPGRPVKMPALILKSQSNQSAECKSTSKGCRPEVSIILPSADYKIIGGGARVIHPKDWWIGHANGGNFLTACHPDGKQKWYARSKDQDQSFPAKIEAVVFAIYDPKNEWDVQIREGYADGNQNKAVATLDDGYTLTGGGALANYDGPGNLLRGSYPVLPRSWVAKSRPFHGAQDECRLTAFAIGIRPTNGAAAPAVELVQTDAKGPNLTWTAQITKPGYTLIGGGFDTDQWVPGHLVYHNFPEMTLPNTWRAASKSHLHEANEVTLTVYAIGIQGGVYSH